MPAVPPTALRQRSPHDHRRANTTPMRPRRRAHVGVPGEPFGPYMVYERLGVGGMATVHRARAHGIEGFERIVALKRPLPHLVEDERFVRAFVSEARLAAVLQHPNIVQLYDLGRVGHQYFIEMEYIDGYDVRRLLRRARRLGAPPPIGVAVGLLLQVCDALDHAHTRRGEDGAPLGLVHRDVSPSNLLVSRAGHVKLIDFGIARVQARRRSTETGFVKGKISYLAPEATRGGGLDARSDLFSAGVCLHELLTARPLFAGKSDYQTLMRVQQAPIAPPSACNRACPPELDAIVLRSLARDPDARWQSAAALRDALEEVRVAYRLAADPRAIAAWMRGTFRAEEPAPLRAARLGTRAKTAAPLRVCPAPVGEDQAVEEEEEEDDDDDDALTDLVVVAVPPPEALERQPWAGDAPPKVTFHDKNDTTSPPTTRQTAPDPTPPPAANDTTARDDRRAGPRWRAHALLLIALALLAWPSGAC
jgi:hypothetical protein